MRCNMELDNKFTIENEAQARSLGEQFKREYSYYGFGVEDVKEYPCVICWQTRFTSDGERYQTVDYVLVYQSDFEN